MTLSLIRPLAVRSVLMLAVVWLGLATSGCKQERRSVALVNGAVDTFDDGDQTSALGTEWQVISEGNGTAADVFFPSGGYGESRRYLALDGRRPHDASGAQVVGVRVSVEEAPAAADPDRERFAADVTAYQGLAFAIKGTPGTYIVQLGTSLIEDFDYYNAYVEVGEDWSEFKIPFSEFKQEGFGRHVAWNPEYVTHVAFYANLTGPFSFYLDNVRFY